ERRQNSNRLREGSHSFAGAFFRDDLANDGKRTSQIGQEGVRALLRQLAVEADGFLGLRQRLLAAAEAAEPVGQVIQRTGQIGQEGVRALLRQLAADADGFLGLRQRLLAAAEVAEPCWPGYSANRPNRAGRRPGVVA